MFCTAAMRRVFADETLVQRYLDVEAALARVQARLGIIPQAAADAICAKAKAELIDMERIRQETEIVGYPKIGRASCRDRVCQYVLTSVVYVYLKKKKL